MSTYLLQVAAGHFEMLSATTNDQSVLLRAYTWPGFSSFAQEALEDTGEYLEFMTRHTETPYQLNKAGANIATRVKSSLFATVL